MPAELPSLIVTLQAQVDGLERRLSAHQYSAGEKQEIEAWRKLSGGERSDRSIAADAVLLELAQQLIGDSEPALEGLKSTRARCEISSKTVEAARDLCRADTALLGPLYEAIALRQDRYSLGQYFTPAAIARFMADTVRDFGAERVLDPAIGAGALLAPLPLETEVWGFDLSPICIAMSKVALSIRGFRKLHISREDFLADNQDLFSTVSSHQQVDAVICNPPYMRHHLLKQDEKRRLASHYGAKFRTDLSTLSTSYVYFFLEALERLRDGGLLVFITPADFLDTNFGEALKRVLREHTTLEEVLLFDRDELAFAGVLTTSAITIARKTKPSTQHSIAFSEATLESEADVRSNTNRKLVTQLEPTARWSTFFGKRQQTLANLTSNRPRVLSDFMRIRRGIATGANNFFVLSQPVVDQWEIEERFLVRAIASARDLPDLELTEEHWQQLRQKGRPCWLLNVEASKEQLHGTRVLKYLEYGESLDVHTRFNCRSRTPWYKPERVEPPDVIVTYMNRGRTRFVVNHARCRLLTVFLNGFLRPDSPPLKPLLEVLNSPETSALIEKLGRTYGSGLGKIEPRELAALPMPELNFTEYEAPNVMPSL